MAYINICSGTASVTSFTTRRLQREVPFVPPVCLCHEQAYWIRHLHIELQMVWQSRRGDKEGQPGKDEGSIQRSVQVFWGSSGDHLTDFCPSTILLMG